MDIPRVVLASYNAQMKFFLEVSMGFFGFFSKQKQLDKMPESKKTPELCLAAV